MHSFGQKNIISNQAMTIQPKLEVGQKDDEHEKEANDVAGKVMKMSEGETIRRMHDEDEGKVMKMGEEQEEGRVMKMHDEDEGKVMKMGEEEEEGKVRKMHDEDEGKVMKMGDDEEEGKVMKMGEGNGGGMTAPANVESGIAQSKGSGQNLPGNVQKDLGGKMGADFSDVKIHTDSNAHEMNESINAKAFTHGQDIYFKQGNYNPETSKGKELLAHELMHTRQQKKGGSIKRKSETDEDKEPGIPVTDGPKGEQGKDWNYIHIDSNPSEMAYAREHGGLTRIGTQVYSFQSWGYSGAGPVTLYYYYLSDNSTPSGGGTSKKAVIPSEEFKPLPSINVTPVKTPELTLTVAKLPQPVKKEPATNQQQVKEQQPIRPVDIRTETVNLPFISDAAAFKDNVAVANILTPYLKMLLADPQNHITIIPNTAYDIVDTPTDKTNFPTVAKLLDARGEITKKWFTDRGVKDSQVNVDVTLNNYSKSIDVDLKITEYK